MAKNPRIVDIELDERTVVRRNADIEHERAVAIFDLLEENHFAPAVDAPGPFKLRLSVQDARLIFEIRDEDGAELAQVPFALRSLRRLIRDYFTVCESYFSAIKSASPKQIEAIDIGRRGLHNEGSEILRNQLEGKIELDFDTARRLFTLVCVLHIRG